MARRRRRILYWHHSPKGFWWIGKKMVANEDPAGKGKNKASSRYVPSVDGEDFSRKRFLCAEAG